LDVDNAPTIDEDLIADAEPGPNASLAVFDHDGERGGHAVLAVVGHGQ
jgi:hypothetical protein